MMEAQRTMKLWSFVTLPAPGSAQRLSSWEMLLVGLAAVLIGMQCGRKELVPVVGGGSSAVEASIAGRLGVNPRQTAPTFVAALT